MEVIPWYTKLFQMNQTGFLILCLLILLSIIVGIVMALLNRNASGKKVMLYGVELLFIGYVFSTSPNILFKFPSAGFITMLLGIIVSVIGLCKRES